MITKTIVINLFGGPGAGKSTLAAELFSTLKTRGVNVELVREYAKEWAWDQQPIDDLYKQIYVFGKQLRRESRLYNKVNVIVTDCPIHLSGFYWEKYGDSDALTVAVKDVVKTAKTHNVQHINFFLNRVKPYDPRGRYQSEQEARLLDIKISEYLRKEFVEDTYFMLDYQGQHLVDGIITRATWPLNNEE